jgi:hypothetical protein
MQSMLVKFLMAPKVMQIRRALYTIASRGNY